MLVRHALPNALGPTFQVIAINLAYLAGGVIVVEYVFNYPGIGSALFDAVDTHDMPVVQALAMLIAALYVVLNMLADIATILVTPEAADAAVTLVPEIAARRLSRNRVAPSRRPRRAAPHDPLAAAHPDRSGACRLHDRDRAVRALLRAARPVRLRRPAQLAASATALFGTDHLGQDVLEPVPLRRAHHPRRSRPLATVIGLGPRV